MDYGDAGNFAFQVDLCCEELVPRLKRLVRQIVLHHWKRESI